METTLGLLNLEEGAAALRVSRYTLRDWVQQGKIPHVRVGRKILFQAHDLAAVVKKSRVRSRGGK